MGYGNATGLRPGRSVDPLTTDTAESDDLNTSRSSRGGFRSAGSATPVWASQETAQDTGVKAEPEPAPVSAPAAYNPTPVQINMPQMPQAPGIGEQLLMGVGGKIASNMAGKALSNIFAPAEAPVYQGMFDPGDIPGRGNYIFDPSVNYSPLDWGGVSEGALLGSSLAGATSLGIAGDFGMGGAGLGDIGYAAATGSYTPMVGDLGYGIPGVMGAAASGANLAGMGAGTGLFENFSSAGDVASGLSAGDAFGGSMGDVPIIGPMLSLASGNVGGAVGSVVGSLILGPIGGIVGGILGGGSVVCTELLNRGDVTLCEYMLELQYVRTLSSRTIAGYRFWAVPLVRAMRRNPLVYRVIRSVTKRFMKECAARVGHGRETLLGIVTIPVALAICWCIGLTVGDTEYQYLFTGE